MERIVNFLKVMADRSRFRLLALLRSASTRSRSWRRSLGSRTTVSWHLTMLRNHDVVDLRQEGTSHYYRLKQEGVHSLLKDLKAKAQEETAEESSDDYERRVLNTFFQKAGVREVRFEDRTIEVVQHRLKEIPTQRKKQVIVLRRLAQEFEPGVHYTEKEVNEVLKRFHPDFATLRRYLVDNKLMERDTRLYWRREV